MKISAQLGLALLVPALLGGSPAPLEATPPSSPGEAPVPTTAEAPARQLTHSRTHSLADHPRVAQALRLLAAWTDAQRAYEQVPGLSAAVVHSDELHAVRNVVLWDLTTILTHYRGAGPCILLASGFEILSDAGVHLTEEGGAPPVDPGRGGDRGGVS